MRTVVCRLKMQCLGAKNAYLIRASRFGTSLARQLLNGASSSLSGVTGSGADGYQRYESVPEGA